MDEDYCLYLTRVFMQGSDKFDPRHYVLSIVPIDDATLDGRFPVNNGHPLQPISFIGIPVLVATHKSSRQAMLIGVKIIAPPWREDLAFAATAVTAAKGFSPNCVLVK
jgi:Asp-tRNA(Asn)/Glu-tRNA(Gln) amidotransferase A subunit family amidase